MKLFRVVVTTSFRKKKYDPVSKAASSKNLTKMTTITAQNNFMSNQKQRHVNYNSVVLIVRRKCRFQSYSHIHNCFAL